MRHSDANTLNALTGSRAGDKITVYSWYAGRLAVPDPLPVSSWSFSWDIDRQIQSMDLTVTDADGTLRPWLLSDPLGVGGARLQVRYDVGGAGSINLGWYRIVAADPSERWHSYIIDEAGRVNPDSPIPNGKKLVMVPGGASIQIRAHDLAMVAKLDRLLAPESPQGASPTIVGEFKRLMRDVAPVVTASGVVDRAVNKTLVYERERLDAGQDLLKRISCDYRMNGDGQFEVYPLAPQAPVATLRGGPEGLLVQVDGSQTIDGLYNQFIADGTAETTNPDGTTQRVPIRGVATVTTGELRFGGDHGRVPQFYESPMLTRQADCDAYAQEMMLTYLSGLTVDLKVVALPLPHLQQGDFVKIGNPVVNGQEVDLIGRVKTMDLSSAGTATDRMPITVQCTYADVQAVIGGVDRG